MDLMPAIFLVRAPAPVILGQFRLPLVKQYSPSKRIPVRGSLIDDGMAVFLNKLPNPMLANQVGPGGLTDAEMVVVSLLLSKALSPMLAKRGWGCDAVNALAFPRVVNIIVNAIDDEKIYADALKAVRYVSPETNIFCTI